MDEQNRKFKDKERNTDGKGREGTVVVVVYHLTIVANGHSNHQYREKNSIYVMVKGIF